MALSTDDAAWLAELRLVRRKLLAGTMVTGINSGGRSWTKQATTLEAVDAEIARLESADASVDGVVRARGAIRFNY